MPPPPTPTRVGPPRLRPRRGRRPLRARHTLVALAVGAFAVGTAEFMMMGLLPLVAADLGISLPAASATITAYAVGVVVGAPLLTAAGTRVPPRTALVVLMAVFVLGNLACALAPDARALVVARFVTALVHGAFFGLAAVVARAVVPPRRAAQSIGLVLAGLAVANVVGVPSATALGQALGWRLPMAVVAALGVVTAVAVLALVPRTGVDRGSLRAELASFRVPAVWLLLGVTLTGFSALFAVYSFIAPVLTERAGFTPGQMSVVLAVFGVGSVVGTLLGGPLADRAPTGVLVGGMTSTALLLAVFTVTSQSRPAAVATLFLLGVVTFGASPGLQDRIIRAGGAGGSMVAAANQSAFNLANALGASAGAAVLAAGLGLTAPMWVGVGASALGLVVLALAVRAERRSGASTRAPGRPGAGRAGGAGDERVPVAQEPGVGRATAGSSAR
ncbi:MFS transporter [uncultured Pseudokineococcus sp.]|uniref:MFS transporter n=1 Tax=uncultured Pseudokineococcus sp. TaxID=1642928 RepID=UPI002635E5CA|nr:MFS transporter [uncultured Pseudokineococcus sp.]